MPSVYVINGVFDLPFIELLNLFGLLEHVNALPSVSIRIAKCSLRLAKVVVVCICLLLLAKQARHETPSRIRRVHIL